MTIDGYIFNFVMIISKLQMRRREEQIPRSRKIAGLIMLVIMSSFGIWMASLGITAEDKGMMVMVIAFAYVLLGSLYYLYRLTFGYTGPTIGSVRKPLPLPSIWFFAAISSGAGAVVFFVVAEYVAQETPLFFYIVAGLQAVICLITGLFVIINKTKRREEALTLREEELVDDFV